MKALFLSVFFGLMSLNLIAQQSAEEFQKALNEEYRNPEESPLLEEDRKKFKELPFFPIAEEYMLMAKFVRTANSEPFEMKTTTDRLPIYEKYGEAHFELQEETYVLNIYQSHKSRESEKYKNYLFLPFTDATNGNQTYGGGRFIDLFIPEGDSIHIDFNQSYNPLCAYNHKYSCPIPPKENDLPIPIEAGVQYVPKEH